jgi:DNA-binding transcriptional LysR family regulator
MDVRTLKAFIRVTELNSISLAAEELGYVQSTVTMQIQQLERELGYPLFDRIGKKISLTAPGKEFLGYAYKIVNLVTQAESIHKSENDIRGILRIGVSESLMLGVLMDLLPDFKRKYVNLELSLKSGHTTELIEQLKHNQLDIIYISKSLNTDPNLNCYYKKEEDLIFVSGNKHPLSHRKSIPFEELMKHNFLVTEHEGICYGRLCALAAEHNLTLTDSIEVDSVHVISELVKKGMGLAFLPEYAVLKELNEGTLKKLDVNIKRQTYFSQILCHKNRWLSPFMNDFISFIKNTRPET